MKDSQLLELIAVADAYAPATDLPEDVWSVDAIAEEVERRITVTQTDQKKPSRVQPTPRRPRGMLVAAAAFVAVLLIGLTLWATSSSNDDPVDQPTTTTTQATTTTTAAPTTTVPPTTTGAPETTTSVASGPAAVPFDGQIAMEMSDSTTLLPSIFVAGGEVADRAYSECTSTTPDWAPSGDRLVFARVNCNRTDVFSTTIFRLDPMTGGLETIVDDGRYNLNPRFSPDGALIAYRTVTESGQDPVDIRVVDLGGAEQVLLQIPATVLAWSPDGSQLAYGLPNAEGGGLWITDLEGNTQQILSTHDVGVSLDWQETGIVATIRESGSRRNPQVALIASDGIIIEILEAQWDYPVWGPDDGLLLVDRATGHVHGRTVDGEFYGPLVTGPGRAAEIAWTP